MTEELTAEERAKLSTRVVHCYDAALARAEAAAIELAAVKGMHSRAVGVSIERRETLEEAAALLFQARGRMPDGAELSDAIDAFLSATPAPAAKAGPTLVERIEAELGQCPKSFLDNGAFLRAWGIIRASKAGGA